MAALLALEAPVSRRRPGRLLDAVTVCPRPDRPFDRRGFGRASHGIEPRRKRAHADAFHRRLRINTGVLVIGRRYRNDATQRRLRRYPSGQFADQDVVNRFLGGRSVYCLDHRFNYHAEFFWRGDETDVRLLHYAGIKPLDAPGLPRMRPWFDARERQRRGP
jgi:hypothetical protein